MRTRPRLPRPARLDHWVPAATWLRSYDRATLGQDLFAALIVTLMLIPHSLAYAMLSGVLPQVGLYEADESSPVLHSPPAGTAT